MSLFNLDICSLNCLSLATDSQSNWGFCDWAVWSGSWFWTTSEQLWQYVSVELLPVKSLAESNLMHSICRWHFAILFFPSLVVFRLWSSCEQLLPSKLWIFPGSWELPLASWVPLWLIPSSSSHWPLASSQSHSFPFLIMNWTVSCRTFRVWDLMTP